MPRTPRVMVRSRSPSVGTGFWLSLNLKTPALKFRGRWLNKKVAAGPLPSPFVAVAADAAPLVDLLAVGDPFGRARNGDVGDLDLLRLEQVAPLAAVHAELLDISDQRMEIVGFGGDP